MVTLEQKMEAALFYVGGPLTAAELANILEIDEGQVAATAVSLANNLEGRGIELLTVEGEYELVTSPEASSVVARMRKQETLKELGKASVETLAVIVYKGSMSRAELEEVRGVNCAQALRELSIRGLIARKESGKSTEAVRYVPTPLLLEHLGVTTISDMPGYAAVQDEIAHFEAQTQATYAPKNNPDSMDEEAAENREIELEQALNETQNEQAAEKIVDAVAIESEKAPAQVVGSSASDAQVPAAVSNTVSNTGSSLAVNIGSEQAPAGTAYEEKEEMPYSAASVAEVKKDTAMEHASASIPAVSLLQQHSSPVEQEKESPQSVGPAVVVASKETGQSTEDMQAVVRARIAALEKKSAMPDIAVMSDAENALQQSVAESPVQKPAQSAEQNGAQNIEQNTMQEKDSMQK